MTRFTQNATQRAGRGSGQVNRQTDWASWVPWVLLAAFTVFWVARWPTFPLVLDPYYHLLIAQQIRDAGGPFAYEWWEYAPVGRPHLYPPLLHLVLAMGLQTGLSPLVVIRLCSVTLLPALLLSAYLVMRRLFTPSIAVHCLAVGMIPFAFHLHAAITLAATLGMIEYLWLVDALEHNRPLAAGLLIALLCYTHLGLPLIAAVTCCTAAVLRPELWRRLLHASWGVLLTIPWFVHVFQHRAFFHPSPRLENAFVELMPLLFGLAVVGAWRCWQMKGRACWILGCWVGFSVLAPRYLYRWLSGEGMLPVFLLAGIGLQWLAQRLAFYSAGHVGGQERGQAMQRHLASVSLGLLLICSPTLAQRPSGWRWEWPDSAPWHLLGSPGVSRKDVDASFYSPPIARVVAEVIRHSRPGDILWSNATYTSGLIAALAHRPLASAMLKEVVPTHPFNQIRAAQVIIWFKADDLSTTVKRSDLARYPLTRVAEDNLAVIFRQAGARTPVPSSTPVLPLPWAMILVGVSLMLIVGDLRGWGHRA